MPVSQQGKISHVNEPLDSGNSKTTSECRCRYSYVTLLQISWSGLKLANQRGEIDYEDLDGYDDDDDARKNSSGGF